MNRFMDHFRLLSFSVLLSLIALSACSLAYPLNPSPQPNPYNDFVSTIVAQTLTAYPYPTLQPSLTTTFTQTVGLIPQTAQGFIYFYFNAINSRNYSLTWSLLTDRFKNNLSGVSQNNFQGYADYWNTVNRVDVQDVYAFCQGDLCAVTVTLQFNYSTGQLTTATYPYTLVYDNTRTSWMFDYLPLNTPTPARTGSATATRTKTSTLTATRTKTPTLTFTFTRTRTPTASRTPTRTASLTRTVSVTPSLTHSPTATLTRSPTFTPTKTATFTPTTTGTVTQTRTSSVTPTITPTFTLTGSIPFTPTSTATNPLTATQTPTFTPSGTATATPGPAASETPTPTSGS